MEWRKLIWGSAIGSALIGAGLWLRRMGRTSASLEVVPSLMLHKVDFTGVYIRVDVLLKNPENGKLTLNYPFVRLMYEGTSIGSSQAKKEDIVIAPLSETSIKSIMFHIPLLSLLTTSAKLITAIKDKKPIQLDTEVITAIKTGAGYVSFKKVIPLQLNTQATKLTT